MHPDIINAHNAGSTQTLAASFSGVHPFVVTTLGSDILIDTKTWVKRQLIKHVLRKADVITFEGRTVEDTLLKMGINRKKLEYVCFGTDTEKFCPVKRPMNPNQIVITLRCGKPIYDIETLKNAEPLVLRECPHTSFIYLSDVPHDNVPIFLTHADVYVSTSLSDSGLASSTAEAMACVIIWSG
jgi:glycosyltransferase involved in cell wall biosynthesis